jgi:hypothetical protein
MKNGIRGRMTPLHKPCNLLLKISPDPGQPSHMTFFKKMKFYAAIVLIASLTARDDKPGGHQNSKHRKKIA